MEITIRGSEVDPAFTVARLSGRMGLEAQSEALPDLQKAVEQCQAGLIVDLADVTFISSAGLRVLMAVFQQAAAAGRKAAVTRARPDVYKLLKLAGVDKAFNVHDTEEAALLTLEQTS